MKKRLIHIPLTLFAAIIALSSNCKKEKKKDPVTIRYKLNEVVDYMVFKKGTYWIYQNDLTGDIDSQWVTGSFVAEYSQKGTEEWSRHITLIQEYFQVNITSNFTDGWGEKCKWEVYSNGQNVDAYPSPDRAYQVEKHKIANITGGTSTVFYHPFNLCPKKNCFYYYDTLLVNYELNSTVYDTVTVFRVGRDISFQESKIPSNGTGKSDYYYAKNVGLIKIYNQGHRASDQQPLNQSWNLIRKSIIQ